MIKSRTYWLGAILIALTLLACDGPTLVGFVNPTETPTKTPRPTFTPRATFTTAPQDTPTPAPTDTPSAPATSAATATATKRPATGATPRPATKAPAAPPVAAAPSFNVSLQKAYFCEQPNDPIWEVIGRINRSSPPAIFLGGYYIAVLGPDGKFLGISKEAARDGDQVIDFNFNCQVSNWYAYNVKIDVSEWRLQLPLTFRIVRSKNDLTPLSPDYKADFGKPGRYFLEYNAPQ